MIWMWEENTVAYCCRLNAKSTFCIHGSLEPVPRPSTNFQKHLFFVLYLCESVHLNFLFEEYVAIDRNRTLDPSKLN